MKKNSISMDLDDLEITLFVRHVRKSANFQFFCGDCHRTPNRFAEGYR